MTEKTVTFSASELKQVLDAAIAQALAAHDNAKPVPKNSSVDAKTDAALKMDVMVARAFKRSGYGDVQPRIDTKTYNKWLAEGYRVRPGEKAIRVKQFRLFHRSQVEFIGEPSKAEMQAEADAAVAAHAASPAKPSIVQRLKAKASAQTSLPV